MSLICIITYIQGMRYIYIFWTLTVCDKILNCYIVFICVAKMKKKSRSGSKTKGKSETKERWEPMEVE